jgi:hypothetical protein
MPLQLRKLGKQLERQGEEVGVCEAEVMLWEGEVGGQELLLPVELLGLCLKACVSYSYKICRPDADYRI